MGFLKEIFTDETGWGSFSRVALAFLIPFLVAVVAVDVRSVAVPHKVYEVLVTVIIALIASSARYELAETLKGVGSAISSWRKN